ncbi:MAG: hypothetical protein FWD69_19735 [Polyangiaceae bacterium]|nr:hypothetical protein [Polyangiaceae bacterium]
MKRFYSVALIALVLGISQAALADYGTMNNDAYGPTREKATEAVKKKLEDGCRDGFKGKPVAGSLQVTNVNINTNLEPGNSQKYTVSAQMKCDIPNKK